MRSSSASVAARVNVRPGPPPLTAVACLSIALAACGERAAGTASERATSSAPVLAASSGTGSPAPGTAAPASSGSAAPAATARCPGGMVLVPGGTFRMGSADGDKDADPDERPARDVTLDAYCLDRTEVTVAAYARCAAEPRNGVTCTPASTTVVSFGLKPVDVLFWSKFCNAGRKDADDHPINCVDWRQADTYCRWAGGRLPTEAEWEHAARGSDGRKYPWGNEPPAAERLNACGAECAADGPALGRGDRKSMYSGDDGAAATAPVGRYPAGASPFGVLDMAGNVWEWTADGYAPYDPSKVNDPVTAPVAARDGRKEVLRAVRGGHWLNAGDRSPRAANREGRSEEKKLEDVGFRCAADPTG